ncbi:hypothetical protein IAT40_005074 [Kwoniella sp. CBS 6097]
MTRCTTIVILIIYAVGSVAFVSAAPTPNAELTVRLELVLVDESSPHVDGNTHAITDDNIEDGLAHGDHWEECSSSTHPDPEHHQETLGSSIHAESFTGLSSQNQDHNHEAIYIQSIESESETKQAYRRFGVPVKGVGKSSSASDDANSGTTAKRPKTPKGKNSNKTDSAGRFSFDILAMILD